MLKNKILIGVVALIVLMVSAMYYSGGFKMGAFYNADALYVPDLVKNLNQSFSQIFNWNLSKAPSYLDIFIFFLINQLLTSHSSIVVFFALQLLLTSYLVYVVYRKYFDQKKAQVFAAISLLFLSFMILNQFHPYFLAVKSAHHYLGFIAWGFSVLLFFRYLESQGKATFFFILVFIQSISDQLYLVHFVLPCLVWCFIKLFDQNKTKNLRLIFFMSTLILVVLMSLVFQYLTEKNAITSQVQMSLSLYDAFEKVMNFFKQYFAKYPFLFLFSLVFYVLGIYQWITEKKSEAFIPFTCLSAVITILVLIISDRNVLGRYMLPFLFTPILFTFCCVSWKMKGRFWRYLQWAPYLMISGFLFYFPMKGFSFTFYPEHVMCVDKVAEKHHLTYLVGDYWAARHYTFLSKKVQVDPFLMNYSRDDRVTNPTRFAQSYSGFIVDSLDGRGFKSEVILKKFGSPVEQIVCPNSSLMIYNQSSISLNAKGKLEAK